MYHHIMSFHWGTDVGIFLFPGLNISGTTALVLLCLALLLLSLIYEAIKVFQTSSKARTARERLRSASSSATETTNLLVAERRHSHGSSDAKRFLNLLGQAAVFLFQNVLGYMLMLSVMVYNVYVFFAVVFGMGLGYFLFGHISMRINMENIRARTTNVLCSERHRVEGAASGSRDTEQSVAVEFRGHQPSSSSHNHSANHDHVSNVQSEVVVHPCTNVQQTESQHTCRL